MANLESYYTLKAGSAAGGLDFPRLNVDMKATSLRQPQSSCPFRSARQKIFGLGYHPLVFVYDKDDDIDSQSSRLDIRHTIFVDRSSTTKRLLPVEELAAESLAREVLAQPPRRGYLTISNALQWRLQYRRAITEAGNVEGIDAL